MDTNCLENFHPVGWWGRLNQQELVRDRGFHAISGVEGDSTLSTQHCSVDESVVVVEPIEAVEVLGSLLGQILLIRVDSRGVRLD